MPRDPHQPGAALQKRREWYLTRCGKTLEDIRPMTSCAREKGHEGPHGDGMFEAGVQHARRQLRTQIQALDMQPGGEWTARDCGTYNQAIESVLDLLGGTDE